MGGSIIFCFGVGEGGLLVVMYGGGGARGL